MPRESKVRAVEELKERFARSTIAIGTGYHGFNVKQMNDLRRRLRARGLEYRVVKNTLATIAARELGKENVEQVIQGPTGIVFAYTDPAEPAKALQEFMRGTRVNLVIRGAFMDGRALKGDQVQALATLPPRQQLLGTLLGQMQAPISRLVYLLNSPVQGLATVLQRRVEQQAGKQENAE